MPPGHRDADTFVDNKRIFETTIVQSGNVLRFGQTSVFKFVDPVFEDQVRRQTSGVTHTDTVALHLPSGIQSGVNFIKLLS